jgi:hypothetical protein
MFGHECGPLLVKTFRRRREPIQNFGQPGLLGAGRMLPWRIRPPSQRAQVMEKINRPISDGGNTRPAPPAMRPGNGFSANDASDNAAADVRRLEKAMENAGSTREQLKISAQLVKAKRAAGQITKW